MMVRSVTADPGSPQGGCVAVLRGGGGREEAWGPCLQQGLPLSGESDSKSQNHFTSHRHQKHTHSFIHSFPHSFIYGVIRA